MTHAAKKISVRGSFVKEIRKNWGLYLLLSVPLLYLILFKYVPMYGVQIAFRDYNPVFSVTESPFVGMKNFERFFSYPKFWSILGNTLAISFYNLAIFPLPVLLAVLLNYLPSARYKKTVQLVSYLPHFISVVVMSGMILQFLDTRSGLLNTIIMALGGKPVHFMANSGYFRNIYIWSGVWQNIGYQSIIYIAALAGVSPELHEVAIVDGASMVRRIWHIDIPSILPTISILLILSCGSILNVGYEKIFLLQNNLNVSVSEVISTFVYKQGIQQKLPQYSYATAIGLFVSAINALMLLTVNKIAGKLSGSSLF